MANRVILGNRNGEYGMWISKAGKSAYSSIYDDLLVDTTRINTQPLFSATLSNITLVKDANWSRDAYLSIENVGVCGTYPYLYAAGANLAHPGYRGYSYTMSHGLGFVPLCHLSVQSAIAGQPYPIVYIDADNIYFLHQEQWNVNNYSNTNNNCAAGIYNNYGWVPQIWPKPDTLTFNATYHITLFRQQVA